MWTTGIASELRAKWRRWYKRKRRQGTFTNSEEGENERNHSCITFTKRRSKNRRGNHQSWRPHIFLHVTVRFLIVSRWHNVCFLWLPVGRQLSNTSIQKPSFVYGGRVSSPVQSLNFTSLIKKKKKTKSNGLFQLKEDTNEEQGRVI